MSHLILMLLVGGCRYGADSPSKESQGTTDGRDSSPDSTGDSTLESGDSAPIDEPALAEHVIVLVMDGTRIDESFGEGVSSAAGQATENIMPTFRSQLYPLGTLVKPGYATGITITAPGHCDLLTGVRQPFANYANSSGVGYYLPELPTVFEAVREDRDVSSTSTLLMGNTLLIEPAKKSLYPGQDTDNGAYYDLTEETGEPEGGKPAEDDIQVLDAIKSALESEERHLLVANLHDIDRAGHEGPPPAYWNNVVTVDSPIVEFWNWLQTQPTYAGNTVLVITADHGRHRVDEPEAWRNHGDHCAGCREIPLFFIGPGIKQGATVETPYTLEDVGATITWMLGADLPYSSGRVIEDILDTPSGQPARAGSVWPQQAGGMTVSQDWLDTTTQRAQVSIDGTVLSNPVSFLAEQPRIAVSGTTPFVCWKQITIATEESDWPWTLECRQRQGDGNWIDLGFPIGEVGAVQIPSLMADSGGRLWMGFVDGPSGAVSDGITIETVRVLRWTNGTGWEGTDQGTEDSVFSTHPSIALYDGETAYLAFGTSDAGDQGRYTRHIEVERVSWPAGESQTWTEVYNNLNDTDTAGTVYGRFENPAITYDSSTLRLAYVGYGDAGNALLLTTSTNHGDSWTTAQNLDETFRVLGHIAPVWSGSTLYFARLSATNTVELCRYTSSLSCVDTGNPRILGLTASTNGVMASLDEGTAEWALSEFTW